MLSILELGSGLDFPVLVESIHYIKDVQIVRLTLKLEVSNVDMVIEYEFLCQIQRYTVLMLSSTSCVPVEVIILQFELF